MIPGGGSRTSGVTLGLYQVGRGGGHELNMKHLEQIKVYSFCKAENRKGDLLY